MQFVLSVLLLAVGFAHAGEVIDLTAATFSAHINLAPRTMVMFYAPWCGHSKGMTPAFQEAAKSLPDDSFARVDCESHLSLCAKYEIRGFPTLLIVARDGSHYTHNGDRDAGTLTSTMKHMPRGVLSRVRTEQELRRVVKNENVASIGFFDETPLWFDEAAHISGDLAAYVVAPSSLAAKFDFFADDVVIYSHHTGEHHSWPVAPSHRSADAMVKFVNMEAFPALGELTADNYRLYLLRGLPLAWVFLDHKQPIMKMLKLGAELNEAAKLAKGAVSFVHLDINEWSELASKFDVDISSKWAIALERQTPDSEDSEKFLFVRPSEDEVENFVALKEWIGHYLDGSLKPNVRSEPVPENNDGPVTEIVGSTYVDLVNNLEMNVLVQFYAPWDDHSLNVLPRLNALGEKFHDEANVLVGRFDPTSNDAKVPGVANPSTMDFPTIMLFPASADGKANPVLYTGAKSDVDAMARFVRSNSAYSTVHD